MGWSCRADAYKTMKSWNDFCVRITGSSNVYVAKDKKYFFEGSRVEHNDGAITGSVFRFLDEKHCRKAGTFRIEGDGRVARYPTGLKGAIGS